MKSSKYISMKKLLFEICYLCFVIIGGGLAGYYISRHGLETINSATGNSDKVFHDTEQKEIRDSVDYK